MRKLFMENHCFNTHGGYGTLRAFGETLAEPFLEGLLLDRWAWLRLGNKGVQIGGFQWFARNNCDGTVEYFMVNQATLRSFLYHLQCVPEKPRGEYPQLGGVITQVFHWREPLPPGCPAGCLEDYPPSYPDYPGGTIGLA